VTTYPKFVNFYMDDYGWERDTIQNTASYLYTALLELGETDNIKKLQEILSEKGIACRFHVPRKGFEGYVDHAGELQDLIEALFNDEDLLMRYLFGDDSHIHTGNDNECGPEYEDPAYEAEPRVRGDECKMIDNPLHDPEHYNYFFKGN
jgi:hypothetical protein